MRLIERVGLSLVENFSLPADERGKNPTDVGGILSTSDSEPW